MKRTMIVIAVTAALSLGLVAAAYAYGPGAGRGLGYGMMGGGYGMMGGGYGMMGGGYGMMGGGYGMMGGGYGMMGGGYGMMGGGYGMMGGGYGMMGGGACPMAGGAFDPAQASLMAEQMVTRHNAVLANLEAQLAAATDENIKSLLTARIEFQRLMVAWAESRVVAAKALPADSVQGAIALAESDVDFWSKATAVDARNQALIASHLAAAKQRLAYWQAEAEKQSL